MNTLLNILLAASVLCSAAFWLVLIFGA